MLREQHLLLLARTKLRELVVDWHCRRSCCNGGAEHLERNKASGETYAKVLSDSLDYHITGCEREIVSLWPRKGLTN